MGLYWMVSVVLMAMLLEERSHVSASGLGAEDASIPVLASGKRQHNIMRFGKRPAGGHSLIHFGKRDEVPPKHSFLYFGKRDPVPDLLDYLQRGRDGSYKRGHTIMRFGKRDGGSHSFIRFGRDSPQDEDDLYKRTTGHSMMYFGKRGGSGGHSMMYFGKRDYEDDLDDAGYEDKRAHAMIHFGKREDEDEEEVKRAAHSMIHFGKRDQDDETEELKRGGGAHSMIHFGKREEEDETEDMSPEDKRQAQHNLLRFGKKLDRKGSHAMIHFGKREIAEDKRAHAMIHFGKRSEDTGALGNQSLNRVKREVDQTEPMVALVRYEDDIPVRPNEELWSPLFRQDKDWEPDYMEYSQPEKKDGSNGSKNVFLRFG